MVREHTGYIQSSTQEPSLESSFSGIPKIKLSRMLSSYHFYPLVNIYTPKLAKKKKRRKMTTTYVMG